MKKTRLNIACLFIVLSFAMIGYWGYTLGAFPYTGPLSNHFDGRSFYNPNPLPKNSMWRILKWRLSRNVPDWKRPKSHIIKPLQKAPKDQTCITPILHACTLIQTHGINILTDPIWRERASPLNWIGPKRIRPPAYPLKQLPHIDYILISHNHYDHMDIETLKTLDHKDHPTIITGLGNDLFLKKHGIQHAVALDWWAHPPQTASIIFVPAQHFSGRGLFDQNQTLWGGFIIKTPEGIIYFAGDTGLGPFIHTLHKKFPQIQMALLPIGAYKPQKIMHHMHMSPKQAVQAFMRLRAQKAIAIHYDAFEGLSDEPQFEAPFKLKQALTLAHISHKSFIAPTAGKRICLKMLSLSNTQKPRV